MQIVKKKSEEQVIVNNFSKNLDSVKLSLVSPKKRVGVLISGNGSNLQALIDATKNTSLGMCSEIVSVISNKDDAYGLTRAQSYGIKTKIISNKLYKTREEFDEAITAEFEECGVDIICCAGFMRILSATFVKKWKGRLLNIHPSLLPKYKGLHAQKQALESGDEISGCSVHFVDEVRYKTFLGNSLF